MTGIHDDDRFDRTEHPELAALFGALDDLVTPPVDPSLRAAQIQRAGLAARGALPAAAEPTAWAWKRAASWRVAAVAAACLALLLGLGADDRLPEPAQKVVSSVADAVGLDVPDGSARSDDEPASAGDSEDSESGRSIPATPATPASPSGPGEPATPATPAVPSTGNGNRNDGDRGATPATPADPTTPGQPATPATPATPSQGNAGGNGGGNDTPGEPNPNANPGANGRNVDRGPSNAGANGRDKDVDESE